MKHKFFQITNKSFDELGVKNYQEMWEKVKSEGYTALQTGFVTKMEKAEGSDNIFHAVLSDALEDRHGDIVIQEWVLTNFKKNAVLLDSHDYGSIAKIIGRWVKIGVKDGLLQGDIEFALMNPLGVMAQQMAKGGFLNALSAGFIPLEFGEKGEIKKSELLEGSMVSVPANPRSLIEKSIKQEEKGEKDEEEHDEDENKEEVVIEEAKKRSILKVLNEKLEKQDSILKAVAKQLNGVNEKNIDARKRQIWKELRQAL